MAELGVEPGADLRRLQAMILDGKLQPVALGSPRGGICQLPLDIADFVGRREELAAAAGTLCREHGRAEAAPPARKPPTPTVPVCVISGQGGVGRTALAVHIAHHVRRDFPDGQLYVNLRGEDSRRTDPEEALGRLLRALGVDSGAIPVGVDQRAELYRANLADRRYLVVLDDAADEEQLDPLLPGTPGCAVLITSRNRLTGLPAAQIIDLQVMPPGEALQLLRHIIGAERAAEAPQDADTLVELCAGLPLAVRIVGAKLAARPHWGLHPAGPRREPARLHRRPRRHGARVRRRPTPAGPAPARKGAGRGAAVYTMGPLQRWAAYR